MSQDKKALASGIFLEGLAIDHRRDVIWYSDVVGGGIHGLRPDGQPVGSFNLDRRWTGGVLVNEDGAVLSSGEHGIMWNNPATGRAGWLIDRLDGQPVNGINEMAPDGTGGIFFGTNDLEMIAKGEPPRPTALYRLETNGKVTKLIDGLGFTNGIIYDRGRRKLYCNDTFRCTWVFDVQDDFSLTDQKVFAQKDDGDGMTQDSSGNLWITGCRSRDIAVFRPDGEQLSGIEAAGSPVTQVRFGGDDLRDCYFTAVANDAGQKLKNGEVMTSPSSFLYAFRSPVAGVAVGPSAFDLG